MLKTVSASLSMLVLSCSVARGDWIELGQMRFRAEGSTITAIQGKDGTVYADASEEKKVTATKFDEATQTGCRF